MLRLRECYFLLFDARAANEPKRGMLEKTFAVIAIIDSECCQRQPPFELALKQKDLLGTLQLNMMEMKFESMIACLEGGALKGYKNMMSHPITSPLDLTVPGASAYLLVPPALDHA